MANSAKLLWMEPPTSTGVGKCPNWTYPNYGGYSISKKYLKVIFKIQQNWRLVGGLNPFEKYESLLGWLETQY